MNQTMLLVIHSMRTFLKFKPVFSVVRVPIYDNSIVRNAISRKWWISKEKYYMICTSIRKMNVRIENGSYITVYCNMIEND